MNISKDKVVAVHYKVTTADGTLVEDSHSGTPIMYLHGHDGMLKALEDALEGKSVGDTVSTMVEKAYGEREEGSVHRISIKHVMTEGKGKGKPHLKPGMMIYLNMQQGPQPVTVVKVGLKTVDVDTNHPYAGMDLNFDIEVIDVRDATQEELAHGHAHGAGGVEH